MDYFMDKYNSCSYFEKLVKFSVRSSFTNVCIFDKYFSKDDDIPISVIHADRKKLFLNTEGY